MRRIYKPVRLLNGRFMFVILANSLTTKAIIPARFGMSIRPGFGMFLRFRDVLYTFYSTAYARSQL